MKKVFTLTVILFGLLLPSQVFSQKIGSAYLPSQTAETPEFFKIFYQQDYLNSLNVIELDKAAKTYEDEFEKKLDKAASSKEFETGEENEDIYILYYKRWRKTINKYVQPDGSVQIQMDESKKDTDDDHNKRKISKNAANWSLVGPSQTFSRSSVYPNQPTIPCQINIYACTMAASNHDVLYVGAETGAIYKTIDKGMNWTLSLDESNIYAALAVHPANPDIVYAGTTNSIARSTDGGKTWVKASPSCGLVNCMVVRPSSPSTVFAAANNGLFKSTDAGATWTVVPGCNTATYDIYFKVDDDNIAYILKKNGSAIEFLKSTDGGNTFTVSSWPAYNSSGARMTVTAADPNRVYAIVLGTGSTEAPHLYRSDDAGATWTLKATGIMGHGQGFYDLDIISNPKNANDIIVGTQSTYKSTDGGATFKSFTLNIHADLQEAIALGGDTWIATDGGMSYSSDFGTSAANLNARNKGLFGSDFWGYAQGWNEDIVGGGRYHNGNTIISENHPPEQALFIGGAEAPTGYYMVGRPRYLAFSDISPAIIPTSFNGTIGSFTFSKYPNEDGYGSDPSEVEFSPYCYMHVFLGEGNQFWKSTNGGATWNSLYTFSNKVKKFEISRSNPNVIYLAATSAFYKSVNGGTTWATIALPTGASASRMEVAVDFTNENNIWITSPNNSTGNRVFKSTDGGTTWINLTTATINGRAYANLVHQAGTDGGVYILADNAYVYYRNNKMSDWVSYSASLPKSSPLLSKPFYRNGKLRTAGNRGIWEVDFYEPSSPIAQPMVDKLSGSSCKADTFYFESYSVLDIKNANFAWSFPGASYVSSSTVRNPKVVYTPGTHSVTLTVSNPNGTNTKTLANLVTVTAGTNTPAAPTITQSGYVLTSSATTGNQWCLNGVPIPGATNQNYTTSAIGNYSVVLILSGCPSLPSNSININTVGIKEADNPNQLSFYPNPNNGDFTVLFNSADRGTYVLEITNALGEVIYKEDVKDYKGEYTRSLNVGKGGAGIYTLRLSNRQNQTVKKIIVY
jgi:photosystem II stability/assembly factor-like uncharacterized protein